MEHSRVGRHVICDLKLAHMPSSLELLDLVAVGIAGSGMTIMRCCVEYFDPQGITAVWILAESHFTLHTYPEQNYISMDCYTCGEEGCPDKAMQAIRAGLEVAGAAYLELARGQVIAVAD